MDCIECKNLKEAFESRLSKYIEACSAAYYRVSKELAAKKNVDMERAKSDLEEHQLACVSAAKVRQSVLLGPLDKERHAGRLHTTSASWHVGPGTPGNDG